jgi:hypothetical protein
MECPRCHGTMSQELFEDLRDETGMIYFSGWRCLICGEIIDPVIAAHRMHRPKPLVGKNRTISAGRR